LLPITDLKRHFHSHDGIMMTSELRAIGISNRQLLQLMNDGVLEKIKQGAYQLSDQLLSEEALIVKLFPDAVLYLESALFQYGYSDRIPAAWNLAVDKDSSKSRFNIVYPQVRPYFLEEHIVGIGVTQMEIGESVLRIYNRDRTICDVLRNYNKLDREIVNTAIQRYLNDRHRDMNQLMEYAEKLRVTSKVKNYLGVWL